MVLSGILPGSEEVTHEITLVQPEIDGHEEPVKKHPVIKWECLPEKTDRFRVWGQFVIDEVSHMEKRFRKYDALSLQDAENKYKAVRKMMKWSGTIKKGWNEQNQSFVEWTQFVPSEHKSALNELIQISSERILALKKAIEKLWQHESRLEAFVEGRW